MRSNAEDEQPIRSHNVNSNNSSSSSSSAATANPNVRNNVNNQTQEGGSSSNVVLIPRTLPPLPIEFPPSGKYNICKFLLITRSSHSNKRQEQRWNRL